jgi:hypothetical protein
VYRLLGQASVTWVVVGALVFYQISKNWKSYRKRNKTSHDRKLPSQEILKYLVPGIHKIKSRVTVTSCGGHMGRCSQ